jgi:hypothetical protein
MGERGMVPDSQVATEPDECGRVGFAGHGGSFGKACDCAAPIRPLQSIDE